MMNIATKTMPLARHKRSQLTLSMAPPCCEAGPVVRIEDVWVITPPFVRHASVSGARSVRARSRFFSATRISARPAPPGRFPRAGTRVRPSLVACDSFGRQKTAEHRGLHLVTNYGEPNLGGHLDSSVRWARARTLKLTRTTCPRNSAGPSGSELSHP